MNWTDKGFLLSKLAFQENSIIANFYTKKHGKCSGIIYGATSKKIKNYLQNGNELFLEYNSKNENALGYFKVEIINPHSSKYFSEREKLNCIVSMLELIKVLTVDGQENIKIYQLIQDLFFLLNKEDWFIEYVFWELNLLKFIGFDLNIKDFCKNEIIDNNKVYFVENSFKKIIVPNFLVEKYDNKKISNKDIYNSLNLISEYMKKNIFLPNNVNFPISRQNFINHFK
tara:strand:+ start:1221 stop:1904 length:684 start_codon:yes stop_codon:yes gene_type:complete